MKKFIDKNGMPDQQVVENVDKWIDSFNFEKNVLLVVPDITRYHSKSGIIADRIYQRLSPTHTVRAIIATGSHVPMTKSEATTMFPSIPFEYIESHNWRTDVMKIGEVPAEFVKEVSDGLCDYPIEVELNRKVANAKDTTVISIGQVVPHEVVGMANGNKNIFVGVGGSSMINSSHMLGAMCGMEKAMGRDLSPVRKVFDYAERFVPVNIHYILSVLQQGNIAGLFIGDTRNVFESAVALSQELNINFLDKPLKKVIVNLDEREYRSTWLGNKAVYRTRMAIDDGGELIVLAKGIEHFGEDVQIDALIRKYGYVGRINVIKLCQENPDLQANLSAAAHLIHGSSDGRFSITYAVSKVTKAEIEQVNFKYADYDEMVKIYDTSKLHNGFNMVNGEEIYYIDNPSVGLWAYKKRFN